MTRMCFHDTVVPAGGGPEGLCPLLIQKGQTVSSDAYALHGDESFWGDDVEISRPESWEVVRPKWEYLPFGGGTRICPAQQLALTEVGYVVVRLVQQFKILENRGYRPWEEMLKDVEDDPCQQKWGSSGNDSSVSSHSRKHVHPLCYPRPSHVWVWVPSAI